MVPQIYPMSRVGRDPDKQLAKLNRRFARVSRRIDRRREQRWYSRQWKGLALSLAVVSLAGWSIADVKPKTALDGVRHLLAAPNCDAARSVGLAPSRRGQPGYWPKHDRDGDGIACEPWPR